MFEQQKRHCYLNIYAGTSETEHKSQENVQKRGTIIIGQAVNEMFGSKGIASICLFIRFSYGLITPNLISLS